MKKIISYGIAVILISLCFPNNWKETAEVFELLNMDPETSIQFLSSILLNILSSIILADIIEGVISGTYKSVLISEFAGGKEQLIVNQLICIRIFTGSDGKMSITYHTLF